MSDAEDLAKPVKTYTFTHDCITHVGDYVDMQTAAADLPSGAYTTFRTYGGNRLLRLAQHFARLEESIALMGTQVSIDRDRACQTIRVALGNTHYAESRLRLTLSALSATSADFFVSVEPFTPYPQTLYDAGVACITVSLKRNNPHAKSTAFNVEAGAAYKTLPADVHEGLMIADDGAILEGLSSNFFAITADASGPLLRTETARVLIGVTRSLVLEMAQDLVPFTPTPAQHSDIAHLRECFITSVSREVMPVVKIDGHVIGDGKPGLITQQLMQRFTHMIGRDAQPA